MLLTKCRALNTDAPVFKQGNVIPDVGYEKWPAGQNVNMYEYFTELRVSYLIECLWFYISDY